MANHLIIGLGGTGGKVIRELRKRVYEEFRSDIPTQGGVKLEYIYVDSSPVDLADKTGWKVMGHSVHLMEAQKVSIHGINMNMLENLTMYPGLKSFLPSEDVAMMRSRMQGLISDGIGGQRRRLGRVLFANNLSTKDTNSDFVSRLQQCVNRITSGEGGRSGDNNVEFHICAGLAGGTGSGTVVDVVAQIRKYYQNEKNYPVYLYLYVPEISLAMPSHDSGFYHANGYAALSELNAMSIGLYNPLDVSGQKDNFSHEVQRLLKGVNPFNAAYLYTNVNEANKTLDISNSLPHAVSDFLFQKLVAGNIVGQGQMMRLQNSENNGAQPEISSQGVVSRSRKFMSFGISRIEYPESEINEYITYTFARQSSLQLEFNQWADGHGFIETTLEQVGTGFLDEIRNRQHREVLLLSNQQLMLSKPIIENDSSKRWRDIETTWDERTKRFSTDVRSDGNKKLWIANFSHSCSDYYENNYRIHGVKKFYEIQQADRLAYAQYIRRHIETMLFDEWHSGQKSILEVEKYVRLLQEDCSNRIEDFKTQTGKLQEEIGDVQQAVRDIEKEWNEIGWLKDAITGASDKVFNKYCAAKRDLYIYLTRIEGYRYAKMLLQDVLTQLGMTLNGIVAFKNMLSDICKDVTSKADARCNPKNDTADSMTLKKYDPTRVQGFAHQCATDSDMQKANALAIRNELVKTLGDDGEHSFANLYDKTQNSTASDIMLDICMENAKAAMENAAQTDPLNKMIGVNVLEKLEAEYSSQDALEGFVRMMAQSAMIFMKIDPEQQSMNVNGTSMQKMIQLCIPQWPNDKNGFRQRLINEFAMVYPGFAPNQDVAVNYKSNQIVVVAAAASFPLRYVENLKTLKGKYDDLLAAPDSELNRLVLHTESFGEPLPALYELSPNELEILLRKPLILAYAMRLIEEKQNPVTQERFQAIGVTDRMGDITWTKVGKDFFSVLWNICHEDSSLGMQLKNQVEQRLKKDCRSNDQKKAMEEKVKEVLKNKIKASEKCEDNEFNETYLQYKKICIEILDNELKSM